MTGTPGDSTPPSHGIYRYGRRVRSAFRSESCEGGARLPAKPASPLYMTGRMASDKRVKQDYCSFAPIAVDQKERSGRRTPLTDTGISLSEITSVATASPVLGERLSLLSATEPHLYDSQGPHYNDATVVGRRRLSQ